MSRRRSSVRGKGAEILFGDPPTAAIEPRSMGRHASAAWRRVPATPSSPPVTDEQLDNGDEVSLHPGQGSEPPPETKVAEEGSFAESKEHEAAPAKSERGSPDGVARLLGPEEEAALLEEARLGEQLPDRRDEQSTSTAEAPRDSLTWSETEVLYRSPPPEISDVAESVLPPRPSRLTLDLAEPESAPADIQAPVDPEPPHELPYRELAKDETDELLAHYGEDRMRALVDEIDATYDQVLNEVGENKEISTKCFNQLLKARDIVLRREVSRFPQAEYYIEQVRARLKRAAASRTAARRHAWWIILWGFFWGIVFIGALVVLSLGWFDAWLAQYDLSQPAVDPGILLPAMLWGGIGGVVSVWYSLFRHVGLRDFDPQYKLAYVGKPFLGLILGGTIYMVVQLLILSLGIWPSSLEAMSNQLGSPTIAPWIIFLFAWLCGFNESRILDLVNQIVKRLFSGQSGTPATELN